MEKGFNFFLVEQITIPRNCWPSMTRSCWEWWLSMRQHNPYWRT